MNFDGIAISKKLNECSAIKEKHDDRTFRRDSTNFSIDLGEDSFYNYDHYRSSIDTKSEEKLDSGTRKNAETQNRNEKKSFAIIEYQELIPSPTNDESILEEFSICFKNDCEASPNNESGRNNFLEEERKNRQQHRYLDVLNKEIKNLKGKLFMLSNEINSLKLNQINSQKLLTYQDKKIAALNKRVTFLEKENKFYKKLLDAKGEIQSQKRFSGESTEEISVNEEQSKCPNESTRIVQRESPKSISDFCENPQYTINLTKIERGEKVYKGINFKPRRNFNHSALENKTASAKEERLSEEKFTGISPNFGRLPQIKNREIDPQRSLSPLKMHKKFEMPKAISKGIPLDYFNKKQRPKASKELNKSYF